QQALDSLTQAQKRQAEEHDQSINSLAEKLQMEIKLFGLSASAAEIHRLRLQGVSEERLRDAVAADRQLEAMKRAAELDADVRSMVRSLQLQAQTFGMSAEEAQLF